MCLSTNYLYLGFIEAVRRKLATTLLDDPSTSTCPASGARRRRSYIDCRKISEQVAQPIESDMPSTRRPHASSSNFSHNQLRLRFAATVKQGSALVQVFLRQKADRCAVVLLDEVGTGIDPAEGAARRLHAVCRHKDMASTPMRTFSYVQSRVKPSTGVAGGVIQARPGAVEEVGTGTNPAAGAALRPYAIRSRQ